VTTTAPILLNESGSQRRSAPLAAGRSARVPPPVTRSECCAVVAPLVRRAPATPVQHTSSRSEVAACCDSCRPGTRCGGTSGRLATEPDAIRGSSGVVDEPRVSKNVEPIGKGPKNRGSQPVPHPTPARLVPKQVVLLPARAPRLIASPWLRPNNPPATLPDERCELSPRSVWPDDLLGWHVLPFDPLHINRTSRQVGIPPTPEDIFGLPMPLFSSGPAESPDFEPLIAQDGQAVEMRARFPSGPAAYLTTPAGGNEGTPLNAGRAVWLGIRFGDVLRMLESIHCVNVVAPGAGGPWRECPVVDGDGNEVPGVGFARVGLDVRSGEWDRFRFTTDPYPEGVQLDVSVTVMVKSPVRWAGAADVLPVSPQLANAARIGPLPSSPRQGPRLPASTGADGIFAGIGNVYSPVLPGDEGRPRPTVEGFVGLLGGGDPDSIYELNAGEGPRNRRSFAQGGLGTFIGQGRLSRYKLNAQGPRGYTLIVPTGASGDSFAIDGLVQKPLRNFERQNITEGTQALQWQPPTCREFRFTVSVVSGPWNLWNWPGDPWLRDPARPTAALDDSASGTTYIRGAGAPNSSPNQEHTMAAFVTVEWQSRQGPQRALVARSCPTLADLNGIGPATTYGLPVVGLAQGIRLSRQTVGTLGLLVGAFSDYAGGDFERPELVVSGFSARYRSTRSGVCGFEQPFPTGQRTQPSQPCAAGAAG
jgi:hypothetical protein